MAIRLRVVPYVILKSLKRQTTSSRVRIAGFAHNWDVEVLGAVATGGLPLISIL